MGEAKRKGRKAEGTRRGSLAYFLQALARRQSKQTAAGETGAQIVPVCDGEGSPAFFCVHSGQGEVHFLDHLRRYGMPLPVSGVRAQGLDDGKEPLWQVQEMAEHYIPMIRDLQPEGPYLIGGYCIGGLVACEITAQLLAAGQDVDRLVLFDTLLMSSEGDLDADAMLEERLADWRRALVRTDERFALNGGQDSWEQVARDAHAAKVLPEVVDSEQLRARERVWVACTVAALRYQVPRVEVPLSLFWGSQSDPNLPSKWSDFADQGIVATEVDATHFDLFSKPQLAIELRKQLGQWTSDGSAAEGEHTT